MSPVPEPQATRRRRRPAATPPSDRLWPWWLGWVVFVVYGSLVPLDFHPIPWHQAWQQLLDAPMLQLGIESRADWVANGVLYLPVGFLSAALWTPARGAWPARVLAVVASLAFGTVLAGAVELAQTAFPPRTVSRNDLLAEAIGTALGAVVALADQGRLRRLLAGWTAGGAVLARRVAWFYALLFPLLALFPFDLLLNAQEWHDKLGGPQVGWWLAESSGELGAVRLAAKLVAETLAVTPLGALWWATGTRRPAAALWAPALWRGLCLGVLIEAAQLAFASGQSQGLSVLTRALGVALGAAALRWQTRHTVESLRALLRRASAPLLALLLPLLVLLGGAWRGPWMDSELAWRRLADEVRFVPFYYHYYTTEMHALTSLLAVAISHAPLGLLGWAWHVRPAVTLVLTAVLAALLELAKLWAVDAHPDPSNLVIAAVAAALTQGLVQRLFAAAPASGPRR